MAGVNFLYYCSIIDVQDALLNAIQDWTASTRKMDDPFMRRMISRAYGQLNGALRKGGYNVPVTNSDKTTFDTAITAANTYVDEDVADASAFEVGDTVRVHGDLAGSTIYNDEFTTLLKIASNTVTLEFSEKAYDSGATMEKCTEGFLFIRECNIMGAGLKALESITLGQARLQNDRVTSMREDWKQCLTDLSERRVDLDGLTSNKVFIETYQTDNAGADDVGPFLSIDENF